MENSTALHAVLGDCGVTLRGNYTHARAHPLVDGRHQPIIVTHRMLHSRSHSDWFPLPGNGRPTRPTATEGWLHRKRAESGKSRKVGSGSRKILGSALQGKRKSPRSCGSSGARDPLRCFSLLRFVEGAAPPRAAGVKAGLRGFSLSGSQRRTRSGTSRVRSTKRKPTNAFTNCPFRAPLAHRTSPNASEQRSKPPPHSRTNAKTANPGGFAFYSEHVPVTPKPQAGCRHASAIAQKGLYATLR